MKKIIIAILSFTINLGCAQQEIVELNVSELNSIDFKNAEDSILVDVRTLREYHEGKIAESKNIDVSKTDYFTTQVKLLDKSKHYFIICRSGSRSKKAVEIMENLGFNHLHHVSGGVIAWQNEDFPLEK